MPSPGRAGQARPRLAGASDGARIGDPAGRMRGGSGGPPWWRALHARNAAKSRKEGGMEEEGGMEGEGEMEGQGGREEEGKGA